MAMRLLHTSDWHLGVSGGPGERLPEFEEIAARLIADTATHKPDVVVFAGDVFDTRRPGPREIALFVRLLKQLADMTNVLVVPGNHDGPEAIQEHEGKTTAWLRDLKLPNVYATTTVEMLMIAETTFFAVPYPHKRSWDHELSASMSILDRTVEVAGRMERLIRALPGSAAQPQVFVGHLSTLGAALGGSAAMKLGWDVTVTPEVFDEYDYAALGHVHLQQAVSEKAWYSGPPMRFGWDDDPKTPGWLLVDVEKGKRPVVTALPGGARRWLTVRVSQTEEAEFGWEDTPYVRIEVVQTETARVPAKQLRQLEQSARLAGAAWARAVARPKEVVRKRRNVDPKASMESQLETWCRAREVDRGLMQRALAFTRELTDA